MSQITDFYQYTIVEAESVANCALEGDAGELTGLLLTPNGHHTPALKICSIKYLLVVSLIDIVDRVAETKEVIRLRSKQRETLQPTQKSAPGASPNGSCPCQPCTFRNSNKVPLPITYLIKHYQKHCLDNVLQCSHTNLYIIKYSKNDSILAGHVKECKGNVKDYQLTYITNRSESRKHC